MKIRNYIILSIVIISLSFCKNTTKESRTDKSNKNISSDLLIDHFNIWVEDPKMVKKQLEDIGFTSVPDSLSEVHKGQGTAGRYFNFLNTYLELIFVYNQNELEKNVRKNKDLDFTERANFKKNGALPFSIALRLKDYDIDKIPFESVKYHQDWMGKNASIYSAKNSKKFLQEPSIFIVYPEIESDTFETISELNNIPDEYAFAREFYKHPNGAKKITNIVITSTDLNLETETIKTVNKIPNLTVKNGTEYLMELYFDKNIQKRTFDLRPELPLIIYL